MKKNVQVRKERSVRIDAELWQSSWCLLRAGQENQLGCDHQFRASLIFTAFSLEAYLNHVGPLLLESWERIERKLMPIDKLKLLSEFLKIKADWSARPWQTLQGLMSFRNSLAHGRGEDLCEEYCDSLDDYQKKFYDFPRTEWEKYATEKMALQARADVESVANLLHRCHGKLPSLPFLTGEVLASTKGSATL
jgi:hypothetical protein